MLRNRDLAIVLLLSAALIVGAILAVLSRQVREARRIAHNVDELLDCDPAFTAKAKNVIHELEAEGVRPWIKESWRSAEAQAQAFNSGRSELRFGFHNITGPYGERRAFAIDIAQDLNSKKTSPKYAICLAVAARKQGLITGILWGLNSQERAIVETAIDTQHFSDDIKLGWDPCHLEPKGISLAEVAARTNGAGPNNCPSSVNGRPGSRETSSPPRVVPCSGPKGRGK